MTTKKTATWLLTTIDNPYSPFTDYDRWHMEDLRLGYNTCELLARLSNPAEDFDDDEVFAVMRQIIEYNWSGKHVMCTESTWSDTIKLPTLN